MSRESHRAVAEPMTPRVSHVGIAANLEKETARTLLPDLVAALAARAIDVHLDDDLAPVAAALSPARLGIGEPCQLILTVGGDGTLLKYARRYADRRLPVAGVRGGRLGFLAGTDPAGIAAMLGEGAFEVQDRMRVRCELRHGGRTIRSTSALNDVVVHSTGYSRMVGLRVEVGGKLLRDFSADGVIVATPTGSTAYSLSAGGPVVEPTLAAIILTPLNPHTMSIRPLVLHDGQTVNVRVLSAPSGVMITVDGQEGIDVLDAHEIVVMRDPVPTRLVVPRDYDFFALLREKL